MARGVVAGRLGQRALPVEQQLQRDDQRRYEDHGQARAERLAAPPAPQRVRQRADQDGQGDVEVAEIGAEFGEPPRATADELVGDPFVQPGEGAADGDLPGGESEEKPAQGEKEISRPPRNRGGGSEAAALTGAPRAPGGVGRAAVRSVRSSGTGGPGGVREGTIRAMLGRPRPEVARSLLRAGCFSHLQKPYGREEGTDSRISIPPSAPHNLFTE
ncbi:hypothetical protein GCM10014713_50210 [Streptomyces purpureus]|uniref:Uncharacterized protein n=1 Tax=Streptomyces purpureus TaxID=1951 RepID=A0A918HBJ0_9ACTN|nr:hypothetical protein GCM10014713_50210 [Streptomyces purpureus]